MTELEKSYDASLYEADIYSKWVASGYFNPDNLQALTALQEGPGAGKPYTIILPPPNVTGTLHVGHALGVTIQDALIRYHRMLGFQTLWLPGTDHAAILEKEGKRKTDLGREEFLKRVEAFAQDSHDTIISQTKSLGASLDWSREAYTLDEARSLAVRTAFKNMFDDGLIYRGYKVINWDPKGQTVISDDEIVHQERDAVLYTFKYAADFPITISTTRPETKVGDTAVAVHPEDARYAEFIGKEYDINFCGVDIHIKIVADVAVEKDFGTGALGVTPAHSQIDAEIAERHELPFKQVINEFGKMMVGGEGLVGTKTAQAREFVANWIRDNNLMENEEKIKQNISTAERSGGVIEPLPKEQWFVGVNRPFKIKHSEIQGIESGQTVTLKELMQQVVNNGQIDIIPDHFNKTYLHWINNLRDWCISRQIWFGHRIPVWYKTDSNGITELVCDLEAPQGEGWTQDEDTLDTWFSSGLWTFSTLGWPNLNSADFIKYHPTQVLETGKDILPFWVARMILMTTYNIGQIPFEKVFLHGMVRDGQNRKMSKSLGNIVDPLDMTAKYGTDALRMALLFNTAPGTDMAIQEDKIKGMKHFGNKLWNITRYVLSLDFSAIEVETNNFPQAKTDADAAILEALVETRAKVHKAMTTFRLHEATQELYDFVWKNFADVYIEASKAQLLEPTSAEQKALAENTKHVLLHVLCESLHLLHPFMPFVTEVLWSKLQESGLVTESNLLMVSKIPISTDDFVAFFSSDRPTQE
jgi:valyl-tRNA synthetase